MVDSLDQFNAGSLAKSIDDHTPDFQPEWQYSGDTINVTSGILEGIGPRYAFAPIPGHMDQEAVASGHFAGIMRYELTQQIAGSPTYTRTKVYGIVPLRLHGDLNVDSTTMATYYAVLIGYTTSVQAGTYLDLLIISTKDGSNRIVQSSLLYEGLPYTGADQLTGTIYEASQFDLDSEFLSQAITLAGKRTNLLTLTAFTGNQVSYTPFAITGVDVPMNWLVGPSTSVPNATRAPSIALTSYVYTNGANKTVSNLCGPPTNLQLANFARTQRNVIIYALSKAVGIIDYRIAALTPTTSIYLTNPTDTYGSGRTQVDLTSVAAVKDSAGTAYSDVDGGLFYDGQMNTNSGQQGVLIAAGRGVCMLVQDSYRNQSGGLVEYVDLSNMPAAPAPYGVYTELDAKVPNCFGTWQDYDGTTALTGLGAVDSGILRSATTYELTYSIYNKRLNFESNVGAPVKFLTGAIDNVCISIDLSGISPAGSTFASLLFSVTGTSYIPWPGAQGSGYTSPQTSNYYHINFLEYRFYYRQAGAQEWLPALFVDAAKFWFYPHWAPFTLCTGGIGGLPGGQPGGFNDYSQLPQDNYTCVVMYKNRAFWLSDKSLVFSLTNNIYAYPQRNSAACPTGSFKGALVQAYYGQAAQDARLVVFSTTGTYVGKFTGNLLQIPVQVSVDSVGNYGLDGSDFVLNAWTSVSAFSYKSAIVAEGLLYMWGPQGVFVDDGVNPIANNRISKPIEPNLFSFYDPSDTDSIHCTYEPTTQEVWWFYTPKTSDGFPTHALVWNRSKGTWLFARFRGKIDGTQQLKIETDMKTGGTRIIAFSRETAATTTQRAYFFDHINTDGDIFPKQEIMVKSFTTNTTGQRRLALAAGYDSTNFATIAAGDLITIDQIASYATSLTLKHNMIAEVAATNTGAGTLDIILPSGVTFDATGTLASNNLYFPLWHRKPAAIGINGFAYNAASKYWVPNGMSYWAYWLYLHMVINLRDILDSDNELKTLLSYRTPISDEGALTSEITIVDNSDENFQVFTALKPGNQNFEGQGIALSISGIQCGSSWVLQYIQAFAQAMPGLQLKIFEG